MPTENLTIDFETRSKIDLKGMDFGATEARVLAHMRDESGEIKAVYPVIGNHNRIVSDWHWNSVFVNGDPMSKTRIIRTTHPMLHPTKGWKVDVARKSKCTRRRQLLPHIRKLVLAMPIVRDTAAANAA